MDELGSQHRGLAGEVCQDYAPPRNW